MTELRAILKRTGPKALVIGDEICRGTETISANAIVASTLIKLAKTGSSFIFATHLHEIPKMKRIQDLNNVKSYHLSVEYDKTKDILIFDRQLKHGAGESIYGVTIAKYIIHDKEFIKLAQDIKNEILNIPNNVISDTTSKYNSNIYIDKCNLCGKTINKNNTDTTPFDTHHINHQKDCKDGFVINKPYLSKNSEANLIILCKDCHNKVHHDNLQIDGYVNTSKGRMLKVKDKLIDTTNEELYNIDDDIDLSDEEIQRIKRHNNKKFNHDQIQHIMKLRNTTTQRNAKKILKDKYNIKISTTTIKKVWDGKY
jgi:DNA mismatch repair protein MutS